MAAALEPSMTMRMTSGMMIPAWGFAPGTFRGRSPARYSIIECEEDQQDELALLVDLPPSVTVMRLSAEPRGMEGAAGGGSERRGDPFPSSPMGPAS